MPNYESSNQYVSCVQVYRGRLRSTGEEVALKVQRPGIGENIAIDMVLLRRLMTAFDSSLPRLNLPLQVLISQSTCTFHGHIGLLILIAKSAHSITAKRKHLLGHHRVSHACEQRHFVHGATPALIWSSVLQDWRLEVRFNVKWTIVELRTI